MLGCHHDGAPDAIFTDRVGALTSDFPTRTSMDQEWKKVDEGGMAFTLDDRASGATVYRATRNDLLLGSNTQLRAVAEVYAGSDGHALFVRDVAEVWTKVMMADRYDGKAG